MGVGAHSFCRSSAKARLAHLTAKQRSVICHSTEHVSTAPSSSVGVLYTTPSDAWHWTGDVRLACRCSAMETHPMKLQPHSFCAYINASGSSESFSYGISRALATFMHHVP